MGQKSNTDNRVYTAAQHTGSPDDHHTRLLANRYWRSGIFIAKFHGVVDYHILQIAAQHTGTSGSPTVIKGSYKIMTSWVDQTGSSYITIYRVHVIVITTGQKIQSKVG